MLLPAAALLAAPATAQEPYARSDDTWINIDVDLFESGEFVAESIVELVD